MKRKLGQVRSETFDLPAPELGGGETVRLRVLSAGERAEFFRISKDDTIPFPDKVFRLLPLCFAEADGSPTFREDEREAMGQIPSTLADRAIVAVINRSRLPDEDEAKKGSPTTRS